VAVTLKDVAELAGVSYATVSRVLSGKPNIRPETLQRVLSAVDALGYKPNRTARSLQARRSQAIGVIVSDIRYDFFPPVVRAIEDHASEAGFAVLLCNSDESVAKQRRYIDLLIEEQVSGAVIAPTGHDPDAIRRLQSEGIPVVLFDRTIDGLDVDSVVVDNRGAAYEATLHLIDNGYERIGAIVGSTHATTARDRYHGFRAALDDRGATLKRELVRYGPPYLETGHRSMHELLDQDEPPDAVFASNHLLGAGAVKALGERDHLSADDVGLAMFDDPAWASFVTPTVTAIAQPLYSIGSRAVHKLLARVDEPKLPPSRTTLDTQLVVRASSRPRASSTTSRVDETGVATMP